VQGAGACGTGSESPPGRLEAGPGAGPVRTAGVRARVLKSARFWVRRRGRRERPVRVRTGGRGGWRGGQVVGELGRVETPRQVMAALDYMLQIRHPYPHAVHAWIMGCVLRSSLAEERWRRTGTEGGGGSAGSKRVTLRAAFGCLARPPVGTSVWQTKTHPWTPGWSNSFTGMTKP
jgi:hypothetical protein